MKCDSSHECIQVNAVDERSALNFEDEISEIDRTNIEM
jgi:hypothetical protein